jgi:putative ABC transport system ATP-binding protein
MSTSSEPLIDLCDVQVTLAAGGGPVNVLRGVSLRVAAGETVSVVGPSGSGKTTMLMIVAGLERPSAGRALVAGRDLGAMSEDELASFRRGRIGVVFQSFHLAPAMTALENAALPLEFAGAQDAFERAAASLEAVGLGRRGGHYPSQLSGGEQQRVAIARAFACGPDLLLADEPTGNLDEETGARIMDLLFELQTKHGTTMLLITHNPELAARCGRMVRMRDGRIQEARASEGA